MREMRDLRSSHDDRALTPSALTTPSHAGASSSGVGAGRLGPRPYPAPTETSDLLDPAAPAGRRVVGAPLYETSDDDDGHSHHFDGVTAGRDGGSLAMPRRSRASGRPCGYAFEGAAQPTRFLNDAGGGAAHGGGRCGDDDGVGDDEDDDGTAVREGLLSACGLDKVGRYAVGVMLLIVVAIIWVAASEWIQHIYGALNFNKPYFITYFNTSMFALYNLGYLFMPWWRAVPWAYPGAADLRPLGGCAHAQRHCRRRRRDGRGR
jgi:hypothetical protein